MKFNNLLFIVTFIKKLFSFGTVVLLVLLKYFTSNLMRIYLIDDFCFNSKSHCCTASAVKTLLVQLEP
jgi:hypothetical protein